jgi:hypothetical protein
MACRQHHIQALVIRYQERHATLNSHLQISTLTNCFLTQSCISCPPTCYIFLLSISYSILSLGQDCSSHHEITSSLQRSTDSSLTYGQRYMIPLAWPHRSQARSRSATFAAPSPPRYPVRLHVLSASPPTGRFHLLCYLVTPANKCVRYSIVSFLRFCGVQSVH